MRVPCGEHGGWGRHGGLWDAGGAPGADGAGSWECSLCDHAEPYARGWCVCCACITLQ